MRPPFALYPSDLAPGDTAGLRTHIQAHTGSEAETESILRSIERYGADASIRRFEVTPTKNRLGLQTSRLPAWAVRAVRS